MSILRVATIEPEGATTTLTLGASGDTVTSSADAIKVNTLKDAGGNTILTSDGSGTLSSVNAALKGSMQFISSQTASNTYAVNFASGLDSTYDEYIFIITAFNPATNQAELQFNASIDGGSNYNRNKTTTAFGLYKNEANTETDLSYKTGWDLADSTAYTTIIQDTGSGSDECGAAIVRLYAPSSTTYIKHFTITGPCYNPGPGAQTAFFAGFFNTTSAINAINFKMSTGNFDGIIALYGIS